MNQAQLAPQRQIAQMQIASIEGARMCIRPSERFSFAVSQPIAGKLPPFSLFPLEKRHRPDCPAIPDDGLCWKSSENRADHKY